jgi:hypothetical protein
MMPELKTKFKQLLDTRMNESMDYNKIRSTKPPRDKLYQILPIDQDDFLKSKLAKGIIEKSVYNQIKEQNGDINQFKQWFLYTMDCWLSVFYKNVWRHRNDLSIPKDIKKIMKQRKTHLKAQKRKLKLNFDPNDIQEIRNKRVIKKGNKTETEYLIKYWNRADAVWEKSTKLTKHDKLIKEYEQQIQKMEEENIVIDRNAISLPVQEISPEVKRRRLTNIIRIQSPRRRITKSKLPEQEEHEDENNEKINKDTTQDSSTSTRSKTKRRHEIELDEEQILEIKKKRRRRHI